MSRITDYTPVVFDTNGARRLTPLECERLQGFPDNWTKVGANNTIISERARYQMIGNAVTVNVIKWIGERIMAIEEGKL